MNMFLELVLFSPAVIGVISFGIWKARDEMHGAEAGASGYFLAGRGLSWWLRFSSCRDSCERAST